ncbi:META domain-containing protein [Corynebacterium minutissimum]|uniref:META domain-containing protein n=1 Tax=Corynebacterium minutissimum TaxID=38301 RepID=UPI001EF2779A|nr:META domain-containing protein [Corynebacterium minutissimum]MCG7229455.1 META domain-containing protein [Corynebacterium minutissimum]MCG7239182.1 META domain-containing protein [Corynebacterium minutissimum]
MMSHTFKKATIATALAALTCGALGTGVAGAAEPTSANPFASSSSQIEELSSKLFGNKGGNNDGGKDDEKGSGLIEKYEEVDGFKDKLPADEAKKAIIGTFTAKKNDAVSVTFNEDGTLSFTDGCNHGTGTYHFDQTDAIVIDNLTETRMACDKPVMADAQDFKSILEIKPAVFPIDDSTYALGAQGIVIQFVKSEDK